MIDTEPTGKPRVAIYVEGGVNMTTLAPCMDTLCDFRVRYALAVVSGHATPSKVIDAVKRARDGGIEVIIAAAPGTAILPGLIAAHTTLPVIAVPVSAPELGSLDALLSAAQPLRGVPIASVGVGGALNAALLAIQILAVHDPSLAEGLEGYRQLLQTNISHIDARIRGQYAYRPKPTGDTTI